MNGKQTLAFDRINSVKAEFDTIYTAADPRSYYRVLYGLNYVIPEVAKGVFRGLVEAVGRQHGRRPRVLDLGCSYGINAALTRTPLDIDRLAHRYADLTRDGIDAAEVCRLDRLYFSSWPREVDATFVGLDVSAPAIEYARSVGLIDHGIVADLEKGPLDRADRRLITDVDLIISTGCVGYVGQRTFARLLEAIEGPRPWAANFVLRMFPFAPVEATLAETGLVTEKLEGVTFAQRRFHSDDEQAGVLATLDRLGISSADKEAAGAYHAELFLSRPAADIEACPIETVVSVSSGIDGLVTGWRRWQ
ncbi:MAG: class I SAM-dependent methyltransferase [Hyphomicrobiaceae bacterium]